MLRPFIWQENNNEIYNWLKVENESRQLRMRILQVHNQYNKFGGEDVVAENECRILNAAGCSVTQVLFNNKKLHFSNIFKNSESYRTVEEAIHSFRPDVLHAHNIFYQATPSVFEAAKRNGVPTVLTLHNFRLLCTGSFFLKNGKNCTQCKNLTFPYWGVIHRCFQGSLSKNVALSCSIAAHKILGTWISNVDQFVVLTPFIKQLIETSSLGLDHNKLVVKPNSVDDLRDPNLSNSARENFLFVGRLSFEKGITKIVEVFNQTPELKLDVVGTGDLMDELRKVARGNIRFHGHRDKKFIQKKLQEAKALIVPSLWYEGLPNTILESFSCGTPVICVDNDNLRRTVLDGYNGAMVAVEELKETVTSWDDRNLKSLGENARKTYERRFTHEKNANNLIKIYSSLSPKNAVYRSEQKINSNTA